MEAVGLVGSVAVGVGQDVATDDGLLHPVRVSKMEATLEAALVVCGEERRGERREERGGEERRRKRRGEGGGGEGEEE